MATELSKRLSDLFIAKYKQIVIFWLICIFCLIVIVTGCECWKIRQQKLSLEVYFDEMEYTMIVYPLLTTFIVFYMMRLSLTMAISLAISSILNCLLFYLSNYFIPISTSFNNIFIINLYIIMMNLNGLKSNWDMSKKVPCTTTMNKLIQTCLELSIIQIVRSTCLPLSIAIAIYGLSPLTNSWTLSCTLIFLFIQHLCAISFALSICLIKNEIILPFPQICLLSHLRNFVRKSQKQFSYFYSSFLKFIKKKKAIDARYFIFIPLLLFSSYSIYAIIKFFYLKIDENFLVHLSDGTLLWNNQILLSAILILFSPFPSIIFLSNRQWNFSMFIFVFLITINTSLVIYITIKNELPTLDLFEAFFLVIILSDGIYRIFLYVPNSRQGYHANRRFKTMEVVISERFTPIMAILINICCHTSLYKNSLMMITASATSLFSDLLLSPGYFLLYENFDVFPDFEDGSISNDNFASNSLRSQEQESFWSREQSNTSSINHGINQKRSFCVQTSSDIRRSSMPVVIQHKQIFRNKKSTSSSQMSNSTLQLVNENERNGSVISSSSVSETIVEEPLS